MNSIEFLRNELQSIAIKFPNVHIKYGYNQIIETHIVELLPLIEYKNNSNLDNAWIPVSLKFNELFKQEEVAFISSDSTLSLKDVIFEFNSKICREENIITELFASLTTQPIHYSFPTEIPKGIIMENSIGNFLKNPVEQNTNKQDSGNFYLVAA